MEAIMKEISRKEVRRPDYPISSDLSIRSRNFTIISETPWIHENHKLTMASLCCEFYCDLCIRLSAND